MADSEKERTESEIISTVQETIEQKIRPLVARDGGDIVFHRYEDGIVYVILRGACAGCPGAAYTLKMGVEAVLKKAVPEIKEVRQVK